MKNVSFILLSIILLLSACSKPEPHTQNITTNPPVNMLGLDELEIGDEFYYQLFILEDYWDETNSNFEYTKDTLVLEVCGINDGKFVISERLTANSAIFNDPDNIYYWNADTIFTNYWILQNDSLLFEQKGNNTFFSHLFLNQPRPLSLSEFSTNETEIVGWRIIETGNWDQEYFVLNGEIGGFTYPFMNVFVDNYGTALDGPGFMYFYNRPEGILRTATYSSWTGTGFGWERIQF